MFKKAILLLAMLLIVLATSVSNVAEASSAKSACSTLPRSRKINRIATLIVAGKDSKDLYMCFQTLDDQGKADVFEMIAAQQGLLGELRQEANQDYKARSQENRQPEAAWQQLIERIPFSATGKTLRSVRTSYADPYCDGSDPDVDFTFVVRFPYAVTNPDSLRSFAGVTAVDAMLTWYQVWYGGISGRGNTSSRDVYLCIGDTGVAMAGGEQAVRNALKLHDNN